MDDKIEIGSISPGDLLRVRDHDSFIVEEVHPHYSRYDPNHLILVEIRSLSGKVYFLYDRQDLSRPEHVTL